MRQRERVLSSEIDVLDWPEAMDRLSTWARARESRVVCLCNVHAVVTANRDRAFAEVLAAADLAAPDGMPVAWMLRRLGHASQQRISGPDLMWRYCGLAAERGERLFLFGSDSGTLARLEGNLTAAFPGLHIAGSHAPPYRTPSKEEDLEIIDRINASGAHTVWVALGCPKQELWMHAHRGSIQAPMIGVGAAFDYHAGTLKRAPVWMQDSGLEWLHRLFSEPRRLWKRYMLTNAMFIYGAMRQLIHTKGNRPR